MSDDSGNGEAVAEIVRFETFTGRTAWDIKVRDKSLKNGDLLYTAPRADAEKDAIRYRWLLSNYARVDVMESAVRIGLDKTIDAAMLADKKEPK